MCSQIKNNISYLYLSLFMYDWYGMGTDIGMRGGSALGWPTPVSFIDCPCTIDEYEGHIIQNKYYFLTTVQNTGVPAIQKGT